MPQAANETLTAIVDKIQKRRFEEGHEGVLKAHRIKKEIQDRDNPRAEAHARLRAHITPQEPAETPKAQTPAPAPASQPVSEGSPTGEQQRKPSRGQYERPMANKVYKTLPEPPPSKFSDRKHPARRKTDAESRKFVAEDQQNADNWFQVFMDMAAECQEYQQ